MEHHRPLIDELRAPTRSVRRALPATWSALSMLHDVAMADSALTPRGPRAWAAFESFANGPAGMEVAG